jgi:hypothetical protein
MLGSHLGSGGARRGFAGFLQVIQQGIRLFGGDGFVEMVIGHEDGCSSTAGEAFDELDREQTIRGGLEAVSGGVESEALAKVLVQGVGAPQGAAEGPADFDLDAAGGLLPEHGVESDELEDIDWLEPEFAGGPVDGSGWEVAEVILEGVEDHEGSAARVGIM